MHRSFSVRRAAALVVGGLVLASTGSCGLVPDIGPPEDGLPPESVPDDVTVERNGDTRTVTLEDLGVAFDAPGDWRSIEADDTELDSPEVREFVDQLGGTEEQLRAQLEALEVLLLDPDSSGGYVDNLSVATSFGSLPPARTVRDQLEAELGNLDLDIALLNQGSSPVGPYLNLRYSATVADLDLQFAQLVLETDLDLVVFTVTTQSAAKSDEALALLAGTLELT